MSLAISATDTLRSVAGAFVVVTTTKVHSEWFPYVWASTLHAARISMAFQAMSRRSGSQLSLGTNVFGFLIMCWGGTFLSHLMLGVPPPMLYNFSLWINYLSVHAFLTALFTIFPSALNPKFFDTLLFPVDAILRVNSVTMTLSHLSSPHVHQAYVSSPLTHMILGALASAGGGLSGATLNVWTPEWKISTPPVFRADAGLWGTLDVWGGSLVAVIYSLTTAHPAFAPLSAFLSSRFSNSTMKASATDVASLTPLGAKALCTVVLGSLFGLRVYKNHWLPSVVAAKPRHSTPVVRREPLVPVNNVGGAALGGGLARRGQKKPLES